MIRALLMIGLLAPATASAQTSPFFVDGMPPVVGAEPMIVEVLAEPGLCPVHPVAAPQPCAQVVLPNGNIQNSFIDGFPHTQGPARLHVERLTYDWSQNLLSHPVVADFRVIKRLN